MLRVGVPLLGSSAEPLKCLRHVLSHTAAFREKKAQPNLRRREPLVCRLAKPVGGLNFIFRYALTLSFGLVNVPVRLFSATESGSEVRFNLLDKDGSRLKQQYVNERTKKVVERKDMVEGYEVEKDHFVLFTPDELKALEEGSSHVVEIVSFVPQASIDPLFYDKSYLLAPDKRGAKPYALLAEVMRRSDPWATYWRKRQSLVKAQRMLSS